MIGHISDRTLDTLLEGSIDDASELAIEEHVRRCDRCAHRLREWELLFPQIKSLIPTGEHPVTTAQGAIAAPAPRPHEVFIPDWSPVPSSNALPARLAWGLVGALAVGAGYLLYQRTRGEAPTIVYQADSYEAASQSAAGDSVGLGSGIAPPSTSLSPGTTSTALLTADSILARARAQAALEAGIPLQDTARMDSDPPVEDSRQTAEQDVRAPAGDREAPVSFPIRTNPSASQPNPATTASTTPAASSPPPLPSQFQRVTLGEAISRLSGTVRLIQGHNPESVEVAQ
jgi:hypothetical protein